MKKINFFKRVLWLLIPLLTLFNVNAWATDVTYTFTGANWTATSGGNAANWTSGKNGAGFSNNGVQVTKNADYTGANATSPVSFENISQIVVTYNTNKDSGAGTFKVKIGTNDEVSKDWGYSTGDGRTANYTLTYTYTPGQSGYVKITANTTTNSIYVVSVTITYTESTCATPSFSPAAGTYIGSQNVTISSGTAGSTIYYTTNNSTPTTGSSVYSGPISVSSDQTVKAIAVKAGLTNSAVASAAYTIRSCKEYNLVTDASTLGIGDKIVVIETGNEYVLSTTQNNTNYYREACTDFAISESTARIPDDGTAQPITLEAFDDGYWYFNVGADSYLYAGSSSSNFIKTGNKVTADTNGKWSIALSNSAFTVRTNGTYTHNELRYNYNGGTNPRFTCYLSGQTAVKVYVYPYTSPIIQTNPTSLSGFSATYGGSASDAQNVYVAGRNLTGNITVTPPTGYEIKKSSDGAYSSSAITLSPTNGKVSVTLNVRLAAGNDAGNYNGNLTLVGNNSEASTNVALTGTVTKMTPVIAFTLAETAALANTAVGYTLSSTSAATALTFSYVRGGSPVSTMITNDTENKTISISEAGTYKIRVNQAADDNHNAAAQVEQELTITVRDVFKDMVNGYSDINGDDTGSGITTPTFAEMEDGAQNECHSTTRYLIGWIKASDLTTIYSGETGYLEDAAKYESNKAKVVAPGTATTASGVTWYAVWAEEESE